MKNTPHKNHAKKPKQKPIEKSFKGDLGSKAKLATKKDKIVKGQISVNSLGVGYITAPDFDEDIEIDSNFLKTALHNDEVEVLIHKPVKGLRIQGEVIKIEKRAKSEFVGTLQKNDKMCFLVPDDKKMYVDIIIPSSECKDIEDGYKVLVKITGWENGKKNPEGKILKVIGKAGEHNTEMESIVFEKGFNTSFPSEVEEEAKKIAEEKKGLFEAEVALRKDFRDTLTFTIDPVDAKDFDDALSFKNLGENKYEIGIHIADVSHYVKEGSELDKEARKRALSVYLVDRTIPMLPEILSNDLCSLNPNENKMAFSAVFKINGEGHVSERWFGKTIINSNKRFSYEEAQKSLDDSKGLYHKELTTLNNIAKKLQAEKFKKGAIDFESDEVKFVLDPAGVPIKVIRKERLDTHKLVEEFMLLANREVAEFLYKALEKKGGLSIYRIHDAPDKEKIKNLSVFLRALGYELPISAKGVTSRDIGSLLKKIEGKAEESLIKTAAIRSMAKAIYSTKNIGHFGLAFEYYTHFTSPIRRYPDLLVQRVLFKHIHGEKISSQEFAKYEKMAMDSSQREISASEAERASIKYKQVEYMAKHIGETFEGIISGVTEWGLYVEEAETKSEGMVRLRDMKDDFYMLDPKNYAIVGQKKKKKYSLGDKVRIKITGADLNKKTLDYVFA
ncbi:MAG: ribonuclease R [Parcubacteria group bacterium]|nr:ribonuclease R [Parcubacteria group bacterium]